MKQLAKDRAAVLRLLERSGQIVVEFCRETGAALRGGVELESEAKSASHAAKVDGELACARQWRRTSGPVRSLPGKLFVLHTIRPTFVSLEEPFAAPVTSPAPVALVEGQLFGAGLLAELCLDKFLSHLPLYRQSQAFLWNYGVDLPMASLCDAIGSCARQVDIVVRHMNRKLWVGGYVQIELTPVHFFRRKTKSGAAAIGQNVIRPRAVGKKNYLFMVSSDSGRWDATFNSLIGSCLRRKTNPREYLPWLFTKLPTVSAPNAGLHPGLLRSPPIPGRCARRCRPSRRK